MKSFKKLLDIVQEGNMGGQFGTGYGYAHIFPKSDGRVQAALAATSGARDLDKDMDKKEMMSSAEGKKILSIIKKYTAAKNELNSFLKTLYKKPEGSRR